MIVRRIPRAVCASSLFALLSLILPAHPAYAGSTGSHLDAEPDVVWAACLNMMENAEGVVVVRDEQSRVLVYGTGTGDVVYFNVLIEPDLEGTGSIIRVRKRNRAGGLAIESVEEYLSRLRAELDPGAGP